MYSHPPPSPLTLHRLLLSPSTVYFTLYSHPLLNPPPFSPSTQAPLPFNPSLSPSTLDPHPPTFLSPPSSPSTLFFTSAHPLTRTLQVVISALAKANSTTSNFQDDRRILHSGVELFTLQFSVGGVGMELGLFGDLGMQMQFSGDSHFSGNVGVVVSRQAKYGCQWDPNTETFAAINEGGDVGANKTLDWENKVVGIVNTVMEFSSVLRLGSGLLYWPGTLRSQNYYSLNPKA